MDVTQMMMMASAITNNMVPIPVTTKNITYSSAIDPYDDQSFEMNMKEGKYRWHLTTKTDKGRKKDDISATVEHNEKILDLFKDC